MRADSRTGKSMLTIKLAALSVAFTIGVHCTAVSGEKRSEKWQKREAKKLNIVNRWEMSAMPLYILCLWASARACVCDLCTLAARGTQVDSIASWLLFFFGLFFIVVLRSAQYSCTHRTHIEAKHKERELHANEVKREEPHITFAHFVNSNVCLIHQCGC